MLYDLPAHVGWGVGELGVVVVPGSVLVVRGMPVTLQLDVFEVYIEESSCPS
jgi:hypothetical protein